MTYTNTLPARDPWLGWKYMALKQQNTCQNSPPPQGVLFHIGPGPCEFHGLHNPMKYTTRVAYKWPAEYHRNHGDMT